MKWYAVPSELPPGARKEDPTLPPAAKRPAIVVNEHGEQIAEFEELREAELATSRVNDESTFPLSWEDLSEEEQEKVIQIMSDAISVCRKG